mmetsp:Transcript_56718/g.124346  ORF Transcript_56718/g.124346 Transcript_56718/m.124346 type:complete len:275 (-) Transcript_56718:127-951(-)
MVAAVHKVGVIRQAQLLHGLNHFRDHVVDGHQGTPPVLKHTSDHPSGLVGQHGLRWDVSVVVLPTLGRTIPVLPPGLVVGPARVPGIHVPGGGVERLVGGLGGNKGEEGLLLLSHLADPSNRHVANHRCAVVLHASLPPPVREPINVLGLELGGNVVATIVCKPGVEPRGYRLGHFIQVLAEKTYAVAGLLLQHPLERVVVHQAVVHVHPRAVPLLRPHLLDIVEVPPGHQLRPGWAADGGVNIPVLGHHPLVLQLVPRLGHRGGALQGGERPA